jgi:SagB-type dehydrogenase family enzyme
VRPRLPAGSVFVPRRDATVFQCGDGAFTLQGAAVYPWMERLSPFLDGARTLDEIVADLDDPKRKATVDLVELLYRRGFLRDAADEAAHGLSRDVREAYADRIAFLDRRRDSAERAFERFREADVLLVGSGPTLVALARAELAGGRRRVRVVATGECGDDPTALCGLLDERAQVDPAQRLDVRYGDSAAALAEAVEGCAAVLHVSDRPMTGRAGSLCRLAVEHGAVSLQGLVHGRYAWVGPLVTPATGPDRWVDASTWLAGRAGAAGDEQTPPRFADDRQVPVHPFLVAPTAAVVANVLSLELFAHQTGIGGCRTDDALVRIDLATLRASARPVPDVADGVGGAPAAACPQPAPPTGPDGVRVPGGEGAPGAAARAYVPLGRSLPTVADIAGKGEPPGAFKVYPDAPRLPLDDLVTSADAADGLIAAMLRETYRLSRQQSHVSRTGRGAVPLATMRPVPSAGGLFPCELYVVLGDSATGPAAVHHYDALHDALETVRSGDGRAAVAAAAGGGPVRVWFVVTVSFWRNAVKYGAFGYRLQALDAGVLVAQVEAVGRALGVGTDVRLLFDDARVGELLGLDLMSESPYAVVALDLPGREGSQPPTGPPVTEVAEPAGDLRSVPELVAVHRAACAAGAGGQPPPIDHVGPHPDTWRSLPVVDAQPRAASDRRRSPQWVFGPAAMTERQLAAMLVAATAPFTYDFPAGDEPRRPHVAVLLLVHRVDGLPAGCYRYDPRTHRVGRLSDGDDVERLRDALPPPAALHVGLTNVNVFVAGSLDSAFEAVGDRWYRMQAMHAGVVAHRLHVAGVAAGLATQINCAYDAEVVDTLLGIEESELGSLAQVAVGGVRPSGLVVEHPIGP